MIKSIPAALFPVLSLLFATAFPQVPMGEFHYTIEPRQAIVGEKVTFIAREFNVSMYGYTSTYEVLPSPISSRLTWIIRINSKRSEISLPAAGYSGPRIEFDSLRAGFYRLEFDSASDFKRTLGDTGTFEVGAAPLGVLRGNRNGDPDRATGTGMLPRWREEERRLDGRLEKQPPKAP